MLLWFEQAIAEPWSRSILQCAAVIRTRAAAWCPSIIASVALRNAPASSASAPRRLRDRAGLWSDIAGTLREQDQSFVGMSR
jgi:hypothetical protein